MFQRFSSRVLCLFVSSALAGLPALAQAQTDEQRAAARDLAQSGADALDAGRYAEAVDSFTRAESLVHSPVHLLFLARSHARLRQYVKAREAYLKVINEALPATAPPAARNAQADAQKEIGTVEPKIGRLTIRIDGAESPSDLVVSVNGSPMPSVLVGAAQPLDPGQHRIEAVGQGVRAAPQTVTLGEGQRAEVTLTLQTDPNAVAPITPAVPGGTPTSAEPAGTPQTAGSAATSGSLSADSGVSDGSSGMRIGAYVGFGVGALGLGLGTVFLLQASSKRSEASDLCTLPGGDCDVAVQGKVEELDSDADQKNTLGIVGLAVGGVGVAAGVTLLILSGNQSSTHAKIMPWIGPQSAGVMGRF